MQCPLRKTKYKEDKVVQGLFISSFLGMHVREEGRDVMLMHI